MKRFLVFTLSLIFTFSVFAQKGKVLESLEFKSDLVKYPVKYSIYFPADYETSNRNYPVLYLLHGYTDNEIGWIQFGEANSIADKGIANGDFSSCIIVMPDGKVSLYCNHENGEDHWEDMFIKEFIPFIEGQYKIRKKKEFRAIAGLSMGGNGALLLSMRNPDLFSTCVAMSAAVFTDEEVLSDYGENKYFRDIFGAEMKNGVSNHWKANAPLHLLDSVDPKKLKSVSYYIDCGDDDFLYKGNSALHVKMKDLKIPHEYRTRQGGHEWSYWRTGLYDGLKYISEKFHR
jgi:S-formylglutathione hydrolase FrmB